MTVRDFSALMSAAILVSAYGCGPTATEDSLGAILGASVTAPVTSSIVGGIVDFDGAERISDAVSANDYRLYDLGPGQAGDGWIVTAEAGALSGGFIAALFDENQTLLRRARIYQGAPLEHVLRRSADSVVLGIMPKQGGRGGDFSVRVDPIREAIIPESRPQNVYLNFSGASNVVVNGRQGQTFGPFDAGTLSPEYAPLNRAMLEMVVDLIRDDYVAYNVALFSSLDGPPPDGPYTTVHFGGAETGLLGLADNVDAYNAELAQTAIVYVDSFKPYVVMRLSYQEMAVMLANVASHELGHLLGLYHTRDPSDLMDTTGTARDLTLDQAFSRAMLEPSVFAFGMEDSDMILSDAVGRRPGVITPQAAKVVNQSRIRRVLRTELSVRCGTCAHLDD